MSVVSETSSDQAKTSSTNVSITLRLQRIAVFALLAGLFVFFSIEEPAFHTVPNLMSILQAVAVVAIIGVGVTISMAVGGFDLSVGALAASSVMAASYAMVVWQLDVWATVPLVLAFGVAVGLLNAFLIVRLNVPDLLATLAVNFLLTGAQLIPTAGARSPPASYCRTGPRQPANSIRPFSISAALGCSIPCRCRSS